MSTKERLKRLGFSADELCEITGYAKRHVYYVVSGQAPPLTGRRPDHGVKWQAAIRAVRARLEEQYEEDLKALHDRYTQRREALEELLYEHASEKGG